MTEQAKKKEAKEVTREEVDNLEAFVRKLEAKVERMSANWKKFAQGHLGSEANDGKIGGARLAVLTAMALVLTCAGLVVATQSYTSGDIDHWVKAKITSDGTFSTDGGIIASGAMIVSNGVTLNSLTTTVFRTMTATVNGNLSVGTNATVTGNLVGGDVYAADDIIGSNDLTIAGNATITSNATAKTVIGTTSLSSPAATFNTVTTTNTETMGAYKNNGGGTNTGIFMVDGVLYADGGEQVTGTLNVDTIEGAAATVISIAQSTLIGRTIVATNLFTGKDATITNTVIAGSFATSGGITSLTANATTITASGTLTAGSMSANGITNTTTETTNLTVRVHADVGGNVSAGGNLSAVSNASAATVIGTVNASAPTGTFISVVASNNVSFPAGSVGIDDLAGGDLPAGVRVFNTNIVDGTILDADIGATAAIALTKLGVGTLGADVRVNATNIILGGLSANDTTNRYYYEFIGTFGGTGVSTQTWPFVAAFKPLAPMLIYSGLSDALATTNHIVYDYALSDTTNGLFYGQATQSYAGHVFLKKP